jgi:ricin-type beta-trefoil lectin protein
MKAMGMIICAVHAAAALPAASAAPPAQAGPRKLDMVELRSQAAAGSCMDVNAANGNVVLWSCHGGANQQFVQFDDGTLRHHGRCVGTNGASLVLKGCDASPDTRWTFADGEIRNGNDQCIDIAGGNRANGTPVMAWNCRGADAQKWTRR